MNVLAVVSPDALGVKVAKMAANISKEIILFYSTQAVSPELEEYLEDQGVTLKIYKERGSIVSDVMRAAILENIDLICVPVKFTERTKGISEAIKAIVNTSPVSVLVVK